MRSPSHIDGSKGGHLKGSAKHEALLYISMVIGSGLLYMGGSELAIRWIQWLASHCPAVAQQPIAPAAPPPNFAQQQAQFQAQIRQNLITVYTAQALGHTDQSTRDGARKILQQLGAPVPPEPPLIAAARK